MPAFAGEMTEEEVRRAISFAHHLAQQHEKVIDAVKFSGSFAQAEHDMQVAKCGCFGTNFLVVKPKVKGKV